MKKIMTFINENHRKFLFSIGINLAFFILFNLFFYCRYHTVDDVFMEMIACGAFGSPDEHLVFSNAILGFFLKFLYTIANSVPWYGILHILMGFFSLSTVTYVFLNKEDKTVKLLMLIAVIITSYEAYTKVQFTKTATYLAVAGYSLIMFSLESKKRIVKQVFGVLFLWLSFMVRAEMFLGISAVCLGFMLPKVFSLLKHIDNEDEKKAFISLLKVGLVSLFIVASSFLIDSFQYKDERWAYYIRFNELRGQLYDVVFPPFDDYQKEYKQLGFDREDIALYTSGDMNDPDLFNTGKMEEVIALQSNKVINLDEFVMFALRGYNTLFKQKTLAPFTALSLFLLVYFALFCKFDIKKWFGLFFSGLMALLLFEYTYYMHGWFDRTTISVMYALIIMELHLLVPRKRKINKIIAIIGFFAILIGSVFMWDEYYKWNRIEWKKEYSLNHEVIDSIYEDKNHIYLSRVSFPMWKLFYTPYDPIRKGAMSNYATYGDWMINAPFYIDAMEKYGILNPYKDIVDNDKAYLIGYLDNLKPITDYICRHYGGDAKPILIKQLGPYGVYAMRSGQ